MSNIADYVKWRGDISFKERPLNIIDNLVFCHVGYLNMTDAFADRDTCTVQEVWQKTGDDAKFKLITQTRGDKKFFEACAESLRFGNVIISDHIDDTNIERDRQFAAMTFHVSDEEVFVVFRGTDDTIVGWKEDFMISYCKVSAQELALQYVQKIVKQYKKVYIAGHSKGANMALYAAAHLSDTELESVEKIYLNDGPGFCSDVLDTDLIERIDSKCVRITPEYCIVGAIFEPKITESYIVKSSGAQLMQHALLTWQINGNELDTTKEHDSTSEQINMLFDKFIEKMDDLKDRQAFVNSIFDTMGTNGAVTIEDFMKEGPSALENLLITVIGENEEGLNPLKSVKDNVVNDIKNSKVAKALEEQDDKKSAIRIIFGLVVAGLCFLIRESFIETAFALVILFAVVYQVSLTIHYLRKSKWDFGKEKIRVNISITLIVAYTILIVKDDALFLFSSVLFGVIFWITSYQNIIKIKGTTDQYCLIRYSTEAFLTFVYGGYLMVGPEVGLKWYTLSCGVFFLLDALFEIIHVYRVKKGYII